MVAGSNLTTATRAARTSLCPGINCSPHIGVYGEEYMPREEFVHVSLPVVPAALPAQLPPALASRMSFVESTISAEVWAMPKMFGIAVVDSVPIAPECLELMVVFHGWARFQPCGHMSCFKTDEVNLMYANERLCPRALSTAWC